MYHDKVFAVMQIWFTIWTAISAIHYINRIKEKNHMIIKIGAEKSIW